MSFPRLPLLFLVCAFLLAKVQQSSLAQEQQAPEQQISTAQNLLTLDVARTLGYWNLAYSRVISESFTARLTLETPSNLVLSENVRESGFGARLEGQWHWEGKRHLGWYAAPNLGFTQSEYVSGSGIQPTAFFPNGTTQARERVQWFSVGIVGGYEWSIAEMPALVLGVGVGAEYNIVSSQERSGLPDFVQQGSSGNRILPRLRATISYAW
ncbi:MAG: hypothetical protein EAZ92_13145 [Candidatus Kapaibacterium sp.]|nr:MAG: hypothetical protein EAZ92_13145 [Candidatus Kapabacteria bacterium]